MHHIRSTHATHRTRPPLNTLALCTLALAAACHSGPSPQEAASTAPSGAPSASSNTPAPKSTALKYLDGHLDELAAALPPPPPDGGPLSRGEAQLLLAMQAEATPAALARAVAEENIRVWSLADVLGPGFAREKMPRTARLLRQVDADTAVIVDRVKSQWPRARPSIQDPRIVPLLSVPRSPSYPSGHAIVAMTWARVLGMLHPAKKDALIQRAGSIAYSRVILDLHFPTDVAAGLALGEMIADRLSESPSFQADLAEAAHEWEAIVTPAPHP